MRTLLACLLIAAPAAGSGCETPAGLIPSAIPARLHFVMGVRGQGTISYSAVGPENGPQSGECLQTECSATVDDRTTIALTPRPAEHFKFRFWDGDVAKGLLCPFDTQDADGTVHMTISRESACIALFQPESGTGSSPTVPGSL